MGFDCEGLGLVSLPEALRHAEEVATTRNQSADLEEVLEVALVEAVQPAVRETWRTIDSIVSEEALAPSRKLAALVMADCDSDCDWCPQAAGHALVQAAREGLLRCVRRLREIQSERCGGSLMVAMFNAYALLKAAEAGRATVVSELLKPMVSAGAALMGFMVAWRWKEYDGYPFVAELASPIWLPKLAAAKSMLPDAMPSFQAVGWDLRGSSSLREEYLHEVVRASYKTYLLWRVAVVAASKCHADVFRILLKRRWIDNLFLKETLAFFFENHDLNAVSGENGLNGAAKRMVADRAKMDTLMYQLVEEYSTKNYNDAMIYTLWKCCVDQQTGKDLGKPKCVAQAHNGVWEIKMDVPLLMMNVEHANAEEEPKDRYKQLTMLYRQTAQLSIQLQTTVLPTADFLQVGVAIKHVRLKAENSRWDDSCMGHFPSGVTVSVVPLADDSSSVTLTNSSSNAEFSVGRGQNLSVGMGGSVVALAKTGFGAGFSASAGVSTSILMKSKPWRFEQEPLDGDDRGGSFKWTLQAMKGIPFDRANPIRMVQSNSMWKWGRRVPSNPLDQLPFTSEGGVQFTSAEFTDSMQWRFPRTREGTKLRWRIAGEVYSTYTTSRYFETRMASFSGEIEDELIAGKEDSETSMKEFKDDKQDLLGMAKDNPKSSKEKKEGHKGQQPQQPSKEKDSDTSATKQPTLEKFNTTVEKQFLEWLEFRKGLEEMQGNAESAQKAKHQIEEVTAELLEAEEGAEHQDDDDEDNASKPSEDDSESKPEEATPAAVPLSRLSRLSGNKGKWL